MFVLDALAAYRLTRLVTADTITEPIRARVIEAAYAGQGRHDEALAASAQAGGWDQLAHNDPNVPRLAELVTCRWCAGMWIAFGVVAMARFRWWPPLAKALALSAVAALAAAVEDD